MPKRRKVKRFRFGWWLLVLIFVFLLFFVLLRPKFWHGQDKLVLVTNNKGEIAVSVFSPREKVITRILIPVSTQVQVAGELGSWKLGSVWQLGINEKKGGELLQRTITKNFFFPATAWSDKGGATNLKPGDRLRIALFSLSVSKNNREEIDLTKTGFLKKTRFLDGEEGFVATREIPESVAAVFAEKTDSTTGWRAKITDSSGTFGLADRVGRTLGVMGLKVAQISRETEKNNDCFVYGQKERLIKKAALVFGCHNLSATKTSSFDLEMEMGKEFGKRF